ncbi:MAG: hypothetical protein GEV10_31515 [Streptosporangiales bacterium]|nr:hypothetical protein [Streptosporangiales bacterium]
MSRLTDLATLRPRTGRVGTHGAAVEASGGPTIDVRTARAHRATLVAVGLLETAEQPVRRAGIVVAMPTETARSTSPRTAATAGMPRWVVGVEGGRAGSTGSMPWKQVFGQHDMSNFPSARVGLQIVQLGRSEAVDVDLVTQRGRVRVLGSGDLESQLENMFGLGVADPNDARYLFGDTKVAANLAKLEHPGSMLVPAGKDTRIVPAKAWWVEHSEISSPGGITESNTYVGPDLDAGSADAADIAGGYHDRWRHDRAGHLVPTARPAVIVPRLTTSQRKEQATAERLGLAPSRLVASPFEKRTPEQPTFQVIEGGGDDGVPANAVGHVKLSGWRERVPPVLATVYELFAATRAARLHTTRLLAEPSLTSYTGKRLGMILAGYGVQPLEHPFVDRSQRGRGCAYEDVSAAVKRARMAIDDPSAMRAEHGSKHADPRVIRPADLAADLRERAKRTEHGTRIDTCATTPIRPGYGSRPAPAMCAHRSRKGR